MLNNFTLIGRVVAEPTTRITGTGTKIAEIKLANDIGYGEKKKTSFITFTAFNKTAEFCENYLHKGDLVCVQSQIQNHNYTKQDGTKIYTFAFNVNQIDKLNSSKKVESENEPEIENPFDTDAEFPSEIEMPENMGQEMAKGFVPDETALKENEKSVKELAEENTANDSETVIADDMPWDN